MRRWAVLFVLAAANGYGALLPDGAQQMTISDMSGGIDTHDPSHKVPASFSPYMRNVFVDSGKIEGINGYTVLGSSNVLNKVSGIFPFVRENGQTTYLVTDSSVTLETSDYKSWTFVSSGSNTGSLLNWKQIRNKMWGYNGVDFPITWDGTTKVILDGTKGNPSVPKFKYAAYDQDRVWGYSISNNASDLYFTSTITTDNVIIAPDDNRAWPAINLLHVGQGDGQIGTGLWSFNGQLRAGKERSIYTIMGDNPSNYVPKKEQTTVGVVSGDAVVVMDGQTHYLDQNGIYRNSTRISDLIEPDIDAINKGVTNVVENSWESQPDFAKGTFYGSTATLDGFLTQITANYGAVKSGQVGCAPERTYVTPTAVLGGDTGSIDFLSGGTTFYGPKQITFDSTKIDNYARVFPYKILLTGTDCPACGYNVRFASITVQNNRTGESNFFQVTNFACGAGVGFLQVDLTTGPVFDGTDLQNSTFSIKIEGGGWTFGNGLLSTLVSFQNSTTNQFISDVSTLASNNAWGNFDSVRSAGGGTISYFVRSSTSLVNIATQSWASVNPGVVVNAPTSNLFVQWATTMTAISTQAITAIDNVTIDHIEGQSTDARAFAIGWKNRYWLAVTTTSNNAQRLIYVKSKITNKNPDAWMPIEGIPVDCFAQNGGVFYGGSTGAPGTVYRLDYGSDFNGTAINYIWDTPDMDFGSTFFDKEIYKYLIDGTKGTNTTLTVGSSINGGTFKNTSFSTAGSGRYSRVLEGVRDKGKTLRVRLSNSDLSMPFAVNSFSVIWGPTQILSNQ